MKKYIQGIKDPEYVLHYCNYCYCDMKLYFCILIQNGIDEEVTEPSTSSTTSKTGTGTAILAEVQRYYIESKIY
jgi:hypothetical protein